MQQQNGGADALFDHQGRRCGGAVILAVVTQRQGVPGRRYRLPTANDYGALQGAQGAFRRGLPDQAESGCYS
jgi:hypothetical protein